MSIRNVKDDSTKLDELDIKIIRALNEDARQKLTELAKNVDSSRPTVYKRLEDLINRRVIRINVCLNIAKLGFHVACVGFEVKSRDMKQKLINTLQKCPRVLILTCPSEKANLSLYMFGENLDTLRSCIESLREYQGAEVVYLFYAEPQIYPEAFRLNIFPEKLEKSPCGMDCSKCLSYAHELCLGCPATKKYKGPL